MTHAAGPVVIFETSTGLLEVTQCTCGRMFDATRLAVHLDRERAA
jgi:hypothetical protein